MLSAEFAVVIARSRILDERRPTEIKSGKAVERFFTVKKLR